MSSKAFSISAKSLESKMIENINETNRKEVIL